MDFKPYQKVVLPANKGTGINPGEQRAKQQQRAQAKPRPEPAENLPDVEEQQTELVELDGTGEADQPTEQMPWHDAEEIDDGPPPWHTGEEDADVPEEPKAQAPAETGEGAAGEAAAPWWKSWSAQKPTAAQPVVEQPVADEPVDEEPADEGTVVEQPFEQPFAGHARSEERAGEVEEDQWTPLAATVRRVEERPAPSGHAHENDDEIDEDDDGEDGDREFKDYIIAYNGAFLGQFRTWKRVTHRTVFKRIAQRLCEEMDDFDYRKLQLFRPVPVKIDLDSIDDFLDEAFCWFEGR